MIFSLILLLFVIYKVFILLYEDLFLIDQIKYPKDDHIEEIRIL